MTQHSYLSIWGPPPPRKACPSVAAVKFGHLTPADEAPMECRCGWSGLVGEWDSHGGRVSRSWTEERPSTAPLIPRPVKVKGLRTHCAKGHAYTLENTIYENTGIKPKRVCRECVRIRAATRYARKAA